MPGFLGTEKQFQARYAKPILQSRDAKSSSREQEAGEMLLTPRQPLDSSFRQKNKTTL